MPAMTSTILWGGDPLMKATDCQIIGISGGTVLCGGAGSGTFSPLFTSARSLGVPEELGPEQRRATVGKILAPVPQVPKKKTKTKKPEFGGNRKKRALSSPSKDEYTAG